MTHKAISDFLKKSKKSFDKIKTVEVKPDNSLFVKYFDKKGKVKNIALEYALHTIFIDLYEKPKEENPIEKIIKEVEKLK